MLLLAIADLQGLLRVADVTAALSVEALLGTNRAFEPDLVGCVRKPARRTAPPTFCGCWYDSAIVASHRYNDPRVQDASTHSLRTPGDRRGPRHPGPLHPGGRRRAPLGDRQPDGDA